MAKNCRLKFLTTPVSKIKRVDKESIILFSEVSYSIDIDKHIRHMEKSKEMLQKNGHTVIGGYISPKREEKGIDNVYKIREKLENSDWLMVDPYEAMYNGKMSKTRLENYLKSNINSNLRIIEIDVKDTKLNSIKQGINMDEKSILVTIENEKGKYLIRNEGTIPFKQYGSHVDNNIQKEFIEEFKQTIKSYLNIDIEVDEVKVSEQLETAKEFIQNNKTISLDSYYKGTYNIEVSRMFCVSDYQKRYISMINRYGHENLEEQINKIKSGKYILVEDDSVYGNTIRNVKSMLPKGIEIEDVFLLSSLYKGKIYDTVDFRDFVIGSGNSGLNVELPNGERALAPYLLPYTCTEVKANINRYKEVEFSAKMWKMNKKYLRLIDKNLKLQDCNGGFINLMEYIGFDKESLLSEICDWHIEQLEK